MVKVQMENGDNKSYNRLFKQLEKTQRSGAWGTLGGMTSQSENEYATDQGYVVEFNTLPTIVMEWIVTQKGLTVLV